MAKKNQAAARRPTHQDGDIDKDAKTIWCNGMAYSYSAKRINVGRIFPRFLTLLAEELGCASNEEETRRWLGVSCSSVSQYRKALSDKRMAQFSLQAVCLRVRLWPQDLEFEEDVLWDGRVEDSLKKMNFNPVNNSSLLHELGEERWNELRREAIDGQDGKDNVIMSKIRQKIVSRELPRDEPLDRLCVAGLLDEKPSDIRTAMDKLVSDGILAHDSDNERLYHVRELSPEAVDELVKVRILIENMLISELGDDKERRKSVVKSMDDWHKRLNVALDKEDVSTFIECDIKFHAALATGRTYTEALLRQTLDVVSTVLSPLERRDERFSDVTIEHAEILDLIREGTPESINRAMSCNANHITTAFAEVTRILSNQAARSKNKSAATSRKRTNTSKKKTKSSSRRKR